MQRRPGRLAVLCTTVVTAAVVTTACTTAGDEPSSSGSSSASSSVETSIPPFNPPSSASGSTTSGPSATSASTTSRPKGSTSSTPACTSTGTQLRALRGSGAQQQQFASVQVTNTASTACTVNGVPTLQLLAAGRDLGSPSQPSAGGVKTVLAPGATVTALAHGPTTCNSTVSDQARITLPGDTSGVVVSLVMRGCALVVDRFSG